MNLWTFFLVPWRKPGTGRDGAINGQCPNKSYRYRTYKQAEMEVNIVKSSDTEAKHDSE